ncbi:MAG: hypothetical protein LBL04_03080 [Bacteroidales bacterium]|jgi:hypothetical protein|nr:hypothetical protein [Bacteroidales bacterium]
MYKWFGNTAVITVNEWTNAGLTARQLKYDCQKGYVSLYRRGRNGNSLIDVNSIQRPDRLEKLEAVYGRLESIEEKQDRIMSEIDQLKEALTELVKSQTVIMERIGTGSFMQQPATQQKEEKSVFQTPVIDPAARDWFLKQTTSKGLPLKSEAISKYTNRAAILEACRAAFVRHREARAEQGKKPLLDEFYAGAVKFYIEQRIHFPCDLITNKRIFSNVFNDYLKDGYKSIMHKAIGNKHARTVSEKTDRLLVSLYNREDKPFMEQVHRWYMDFVAGREEFFDSDTGEVFKPKDFQLEGKPLELSLSTVRNRLKKIPAIAATLRKRDGYFNEKNNFAPKHERKRGEYSLSKITMDDVTLSRKSHKGWVNLYAYTDVVSGYAFPSAYIEGKPTIKTVEEAHRNMVRELVAYGLPKPAESDNEHHLIKDIPWWGDFWDIVTFNDSATSKRQEHFNRQQKYGVKKKNGHVNNRWYGRGAYAGVRYKESGEFVEKTYDFEQLVADDVQDREEWNNSLHPDQKTYEGMTRKDVLLKHCKPDLGKIEPRYHYRMFCEPVKTSIRNNKRIQANNQIFWLKDVESLERLKPNSYEVEACFLSDANGNVDTIYLYQGDVYIGEAFNIESYRYNECRAEWTDRDEENYLFQNKETSRFYGKMKEWKEGLVKVGQMSADASREIAAVKSLIMEPAPAKEPDPEPDYEFEDCESNAIKML